MEWLALVYVMRSDWTIAPNRVPSAYGSISPESPGKKQRPLSDASFFLAGCAIGAISSAAAKNHAPLCERLILPDRKPLSGKRSGWYTCSFPHVCSLRVPSADLLGRVRRCYCVPWRSRIVQLFAADGFHETLERAVGQVGEPFLVIDRGGVADLVMGPPTAASAVDLARLVAFVPACRLDQLGDSSFREAHGTRFACMAGAMANGIGSVEVVEAMGRQGMLAFSERRGCRSRLSSARSTGSTAARASGSRSAST